MTHPISEATGISAEQLANAAIVKQAQSPIYPGLTIGGLVATTLVYGVAGATLIPVITGAVFALGLFMSAGRLFSIYNAGECDDFDGVLKRLPKNDRKRFMSALAQQIDRQEQAMALPAASDHIDTEAVEIGGENPFQMDAVPVPAFEPEPIDPQQDDLSQYWDVPVNDEAVLDLSDGSSNVLPLEDLAQTIGQCPEDESNFIFVGKSRSGKTSMILNAMKAKETWTKKTSAFIILNGKHEHTTNWGGLVDTTAYHAINTRDRAQQGFSIVNKLVAKLQEWQDNPKNHPSLFLVADEVNNQRTMLPKAQREDYSENLSLFATQCMSERSGLWLSSHSHLVNDVGLNRQIQQSFQIVALGRNGKYESIAAVLDDPYIIRDNDTKSALKDQLRNYVSQGGNGAIAFTNQGGDNRLVALPNYTKDLEIFSIGAAHKANPVEPKATQDESTSDGAIAPSPPSFTEDEQLLIEKMRSLKAEHPDWGKTAIVCAATGKAPGENKLYKTAVKLYGDAGL